MGNTQCAKFCGLERDSGLRSSIILEGYNVSQEIKQVIEGGKKQDYIDRYNNSQSLSKIVRIQKRFRNYLVQQGIKSCLNYHSLVLVCKEDLKETLTPNKLIDTTLKFCDFYIYASGQVYIGEWLGGFRHGYGIMIQRDDIIYNGNWEYGYPQGFGSCIFSDGDTFKGNWKHPYNPVSQQQQQDSNPDGYLWFYNKNRDRIAEQNNFSRQLVGMLLKIQKATQKVERIDNLIQQQSKITFSGQYYSNYTYPNGMVYNGFWVNDTRHGHGLNRWPSGDTYIGQWRQDMQQGWGKSNWIDQSFFYGTFKENQKHGIGQYYWPDTSTYVGQWQDNKIQGAGRYQWQDGRKYVGEWCNGVMHGLGVFYSNSKIYIGDWFCGKKHGIGLTFCSNGRIFKEIWVHGKAIQSLS